MKVFIKILFVIIIIAGLLKAQSFKDRKNSSQDVLRDSLIELRWAEREIEDISSIVPGNIYIHEEATEEIFKNQSPQTDIIHLATHTIIDDERPMYSKLILAPGDESSNEDGYLNTYELYNLNLNADLVVLSACNTGYGKLVQGEGIMSLARGFIYAGCPSIVMSLWPVDDKSTSLLMKDFYQGLEQNLCKDEALRYAKLNFLKNADAVKANPFYWAGFISIGNTQPIKIQKKINYIVWILVITFLFLTLFLIIRKKGRI